jgi:hypothetical protein
MRRFLIPLLIVVGGSLAVYVAQGRSSSGSAAASRALAAAKQQMVWSSGPKIQSVHTLKLSGLRRALDHVVARQVANDVNVADLMRRFGPRRAVTLVVIHGTYNSLPPDEGVPITGQAVVILDHRSNRVLLLMD